MPEIAAPHSAPWRVVASAPETDTGQLHLERGWTGSVCGSKLTNRGSSAVGVREVVVLDISHDFPGDTPIYGEGFTMLSQTIGTIAAPQKLGHYTDRDHYRIPQPDDATTVYGLLTIKPEAQDYTVFAFASCRRFSGQFYLRGDSIQVVVDCEGLSIEPGESWQMEDVMIASGPDRDAILASLVDQMRHSHDMWGVRLGPPPAGWCSWYCFGADVTAEQVRRNADYIAANLPELRYIQIDDGYQPAMGDWLDVSDSFGGIRYVIRHIRSSGFQPALWVAPFVAEENSKVFREHPHWFVRDADGSPLRSDKVTFGGWRHGPWYVLDGTHPEVNNHLENMFRFMYKEWGITYFKLDANFWGAIHGGRFHDPKATRVQAYHSGMEAILRGTNRECTILGCNHPMWPSIGTITASRSSDDISRKWSSFTTTARENLLRNWQNGRLWWNDPDCIVLTGDLTDDEYLFHSTVIYASGGLVLSGDDLPTLRPDRLAILRKLLPPSGRAARFMDDSLEVGVIDHDGKQAFCLLNWDDAPTSLAVPLPARGSLVDYWTDERFGVQAVPYTVEMAPRSGKVLVWEPA